MRTNKRPARARTHEGAKASTVSAKDSLTRTVLACMLWEDSFYEDGVSITDRIEQLVPLVPADTVSEIAITAREKMKLRHVPLLLCSTMAKHKMLRASVLEQVIRRPDELSEFLAIYWKAGRCPIAKQAKLGLRKAFTKFSEYQFAKWNNKDREIKLRDVMFMCHPKPKDDEQAEVFRRLASDELATPDTWEVNLSAGKDKKETWERLLAEKKLGAMALLRNLRNMGQAGVSSTKIFEALDQMDIRNVLPFRFISAAVHAPQWESRIEKALMRCVADKDKIPGKTVLLVDVSGSMIGDKVSKRSDIDRLDAACGLAMIARELCEDIEIFTFSDSCVRVPDRHGFALKDAIKSSQRHGSTYLAEATRTVNSEVKYDRIIVITDEQSHDGHAGPTAKGYMINVACYKNGVGYGPWTHISGWSESVLDYIRVSENIDTDTAETSDS